MDELESFARKNRILNAIPTSELHRLLALMERVQLYPRQVLERPGGGSEDHTTASGRYAWSHAAKC